MSADERSGADTMSGADETHGDHASSESWLCPGCGAPATWDTLATAEYTCPACGQPGSAVYRVTGVYGLKALQDWLNGVVREN